MRVTEKHSPAFILRNAFFDAALRLPFFANGGFSTRKVSRQFPIQKEQLPVLGVYLIDETMGPDGDGDAGNIRFALTARIGFSVVIANNDPIASEEILDEAFWALMNGLWRDQYLTNLLDTYNPHVGAGTPGNTRFESVARGIRQHRFGAVGQNNETPVAELQYDVSIFHRYGFEPIIEDELEEIDVTTAFPPGATAEERARIQQVRQVMRFNRQQRRRP
jgi:hypothetical protein